MGSVGHGYSGEIIMSDLATHIKNINSKHKAEMESNPNVWIGMVVEDLDHWAQYGVYTPAQFDRYQDECSLYEAVSQATSKSYARTVVANTDGMSDEEFKKELDHWWNQAEVEAKREAEEEAVRVKEFEGQILNTIKNGAGDRKTAIKWILQGEELDKERDKGYICYSLGLPYSFEKEFTEVLG